MAGMPAQAAGLLIRRATPDDAPALAATLAHPAVQPNLLQLPYANEAAWRHRLSEREQPGQLEVVLVAERSTGKGGRQVIGNAGLHPAGYQLRRRHAATLGIAVLPESQGQGVGRALMQALLDYADPGAQVPRLERTVFTDNSRAIALYESLGFRTEGRHVGYAMRHGRYEDVLSMARLHPAPPACRWPDAAKAPP